MAVRIDETANSDASDSRLPSRHQLFPPELADDLGYAVEDAETHFPVTSLCPGLGLLAWSRCAGSVAGCGSHCLTDSLAVVVDIALAGSIGLATRWAGLFHGWSSRSNWANKRAADPESGSAALVASQVLS